MGVWKRAGQGLSQAQNNQAIAVHKVKNVLNCFFQANGTWREVDLNEHPHARDESRCRMCAEILSSEKYGVKLRQGVACLNQWIRRNAGIL